MAKTNLRHWLPRLFLVCASLLLALVGAEFALPLTGLVLETDQSNARCLFDRGGDYDTLRPNLQAVLYTGVPVSTNAFGYRCPRMRLDREVPGFRVAILGDSWGFGWGLPDERTIVGGLEALLRKEYPAENVEVFNFSVPGYNLED